MITGECIFKYSAGSEEKNGIDVPLVFSYNAEIRFENNEYKLLIKQSKIAQDIISWYTLTQFPIVSEKCTIEISDTTYKIIFNNAHRKFYQYNNEYIHIGISVLIDQRIIDNKTSACRFKLCKTQMDGISIGNCNYEGVSIKDNGEYYSIEIKNQTPKLSKDFDNDMKSIRILFTFLTGHSFYENDVAYKINEVWCKKIYISNMFTHKYASSLYVKGRIEILDKINIAEMCNNWISSSYINFLLTNEHNILCNLEIFHTKSYRPPDMFFRQIFSVLEAFIDCYLDEKDKKVCDINDNEYEELKKDILDLISKSKISDIQKEEMKDRNSLLNENKTKKRFKCLCEKVSSAIATPLLNDNVRDAIVDTRNWLVHGTKKNKKCLGITQFVYVIWFLRELLITAIMYKVFSQTDLSLSNNAWEYNIYTLCETLNRSE